MIHSLFATYFATVRSSYNTVLQLILIVLAKPRLAKVGVAAAAPGRWEGAGGICQVKLEKGVYQCIVSRSRAQMESHCRSSRDTAGISIMSTLAA